MEPEIFGARHIWRHDQNWTTALFSMAKFHKPGFERRAYGRQA
jgi:hypothetical protein